MKIEKRIISLILLICIVFIPQLSIAGENEGGQNNIVFYTYGDVSRPETRINMLQISGINTLVIPSNVSKNSVRLFCDSYEAFRVKGALSEVGFVSGQTLDLTALCREGEYLLKFIDGGSEYELKILFSDNIPSLYLLSEDPENEGRLWVESSVDKSNKAKGNMVLLGENGDIIHSGGLTQIKGRGNTTWGLVKKPYQIKLEEKVDLIRTGDDSNKSKTWVLLANYLDPVGIRNTIALNLGRALGMPMNVQGESIDLYYDGEYRGMYMLTEKVEVGSGRVDVADLEEENQKANPDKEFEDFPIAEGYTENGAAYTYCEGMISPEDITGGYLLEMDYKVRALEEICYIRTNRDNYVVVKSPEYASKEEMNYIATMYQEYEDSVYEGGVNSKTNKKYSDYIDERSLACYYIINEFSKSRDFFSSSAYLSKKNGEDKFVMGPLWDYDMSFGTGSIEDNNYVDDNPFGIIATNYSMGNALLQIPDFCNYVKEFYLKDFSPLIENVLLGGKDAISKDGSLHSLKYYGNLLLDSAQCNSDLWYNNQIWGNETTKLHNFVKQRYSVINDYYNVFPIDFKLPDNAYYDVLSWDWFYDVVTEASQKSLLVGDGYGFFRPRENITRAQTAQILLTLMGVETVENRQIFTDVNINDWYSEAVVWSSDNGYLQGYPDGTFNPNDTITREEFVTVLHKISGSPIVESDLIQGFYDKDLITSTDAIEWALKEGILVGANNCINPMGNITRAEMAAILVRYHEKYENS